MDQRRRRQVRLLGRGWRSWPREDIFAQVRRSRSGTQHLLHGKVSETRGLALLRGIWNLIWRNEDANRSKRSARVKARVISAVRNRLQTQILESQERRSQGPGFHAIQQLQRKPTRSSLTLSPPPPPPGTSCLLSVHAIHFTVDKEPKPN